MYIDAHAHLDGYDDFGPGALDSALEDIAREHIFTISNSMDVPSYRRNLEIAARSPWVLPVFGIHPWNAHLYAGRREEIAGLVDESPIFGEIGLDHFFVKDESLYSAQNEVFESFLGAARRQGKIVIAHAKGAERDVLETLDRYALPRVVIHWYSGPLDVFREMAARGFYFTVGGEFLRSKILETIAREVPPDRLLTETDNPGGPKSYLGRTGRPAFIRDIVRGLAAVRGGTEEGLAAAVRSNLETLFRGDARLTGVLDRVSSGR